jgi:hypothetical protein
MINENGGFVKLVAISATQFWRIDGFWFNPILEMNFLKKMEDRQQGQTKPDLFSRPRSSAVFFALNVRLSDLSVFSIFERLMPSLSAIVS